MPNKNEEETEKLDAQEPNITPDEAYECIQFIREEFDWFDFSHALMREARWNSTPQYSAVNHEAVSDYRSLLSQLKKSELVELVIQDRMTIDFLRRQFNSFRLNSVQKVSAGKAIYAAARRAKSETAKRAATARWESDPIKEMKEAIHAEWKLWQTDRRKYRRPRDFRREMTSRFPEVVDGTLKNWMSSWGRKKET